MGFARLMLIVLHHVPAIARMANVILVPIVPKIVRIPVTKKVNARPQLALKNASKIAMKI